jgi:hypothetical protein
VLGLVLLALCAGCATTPAPPQVSENLLTAAGFQTVDAQTDQQRQHLQALEQGALSEIQRTGKHYYVYPDVAGRRLYVGTPNEYQKYLDLRRRNGLPNPPASNATSTDMQQYLQRDAAMAKADTQVREAYPWAMWPDFAVMIWSR